MSRQYTPKSFLLQIRSDLLKAYFVQQECLTDFDWSSLNKKKKDINPLHQRWLQLSDSKRQTMEAEFSEIHDMACELGIRMLVEEGNFRGRRFGEELDKLEGFHSKAMWTWLYHRDIFENVSIFTHAHQLSMRYWKKRTGLPRKAPEYLPTVLVSFGKAVSDYYQTLEGRGQLCEVEHYLRGGRHHYYFTYPNDYAQTYLGYGNDERLERRPHRPALENIFVYDPEAGSLDLYAKGDRSVIHRLQSLFCEYILHERLPEEKNTSPFQLDQLIRRGNSFPTDPKDGIQEVRIHRMRITFEGTMRRITLESDPSGKRDDIYSMLEEYMRPELLRSRGVHVTQITLQFRFHPIGNKRVNQISFDITAPNSCSLKNLPEKYRVMAEKYIQAWGIQHVESLPPAMPKCG